MQVLGVGVAVGAGVDVRIHLKGAGMAVGAGIGVGIPVRRRCSCAVGAGVGVGAPVRCERSCVGAAVAVGAGTRCRCGAVGGAMPRAEPCPLSALRSPPSAQRPPLSALPRPRSPLPAPRSRPALRGSAVRAVRQAGRAVPPPGLPGPPPPPPDIGWKVEQRGGDGRCGSIAARAAARPHAVSGTAGPIPAAPRRRRVAAGPRRPRVPLRSPGIFVVTPRDPLTGGGRRSGADPREGIVRNRAAAETRKGTTKCARRRQGERCPAPSCALRRPGAPHRGVCDVSFYFKAERLRSAAPA